MYKKLIFQFIPIILIFLFVVYPKNAIFWSNTILGKIIAIIIVLFYSTVDIAYGIMVSLLFVLYYQMGNQYSEGMENDLRKQFEKQYCENGVLKYKTMQVKPEMTEHIFPEIEYEDETLKCNPCDSTCNYKIIEERITNESKIQEPKNSKDWVWTQWFSTTKTDDKKPIKPPQDSIGVKTEPFSFF
jgi:NAD-dependent dihydropyrimidine dehydrogenase PreA subunit